MVQQGMVHSDSVEVPTEARPMAAAPQLGVYVACMTGRSRVCTVRASITAKGVELRVQSYLRRSSSVCV